MAVGGEPNFEEWIAQIGGITENGRSKLEKATIVSMASIRLITEEDIDEIRLGLGDRAIFKQGWRAVKGLPDTTKASPEPTEDLTNIFEGTSSTTRTEPSLYTLSDFAELLKRLPATPTAPRPENTATPTLQQAQGACSHFGEQAAQVTVQTLSKNIALKELAASLGLQAPADTIPLDHYSFDSNDKGER